MGHGIAQVAAMAGLSVALVDTTQDLLRAALDRIRGNLDEGVRRGKVDESVREAALANLRAETSLGNAVRDADLVIEAVPERLELKKQVFGELERHAPASAILATNTSGLSVTEIQNSIRGAGRVLGLHFFNPVHINALVEVVRGEHTDPGVGDAGAARAQRLVAAGRPARPRGDAHARGGRGRRTGDRQGDGSRLPAPHGPAPPHRPGRPRRAARHRALPVRQARRRALPSAGDPRAARRGRTPRQEDRARVLHVGAVMETGSYEALLVHVDDGVATITVNRPEKRNALNAAVRRELIQALDALAADGDVRVLILTGAGEKAFIAGADVAEFAQRTPLEQRGAMSGRTAAEALAAFPLPTIAMINGYALGGGCELALACDLRVAARSARLGQPEIKLGLIPGAGGTQRLPRLVGLGAAMRLVLTGELIGAEEAARIGLVDLVVDDAELAPRTQELARTIASHSPVAVRLA